MFDADLRLDRHLVDLVSWMSGPLVNPPDRLSASAVREAENRSGLRIRPRLPIPVGPLSTRILTRAGTDSPGREINEMIKRGAARCPVRDATKRAVEVTTEVELQ
jgi:hypothetical protein